MKNIIRIIISAVLLGALAFPAFADVTETAPIGSLVIFKVSVATGTAPFAYQWRKDGVNISGATAASYTIAAISATDAGTYTATVTNSAGTTTSDKGIFTVTVAPGGVTVSISKT